jgi:hypothetical protein
MRIHACRDGDEVSATLVTSLALERDTGHAQTSKWANEAFSSGNGPIPREDTSGLDLDGEPDSSTVVTIRSKAQFMRLLLRSQMVDVTLTERQVNLHFRAVLESMPRLSSGHADQFRNIFEAHFLPLREVFQYYAPDELMTKENLIRFTEECELFARDSVMLSSRIHNRTVLAMSRYNANTNNTTPSSYGLGGFMVALILAAQLRHNDTFECESLASASACAALQEIMDRNVVELAERMYFPSVSRLVFCSDEVLYGIRLYHVEMFTVFEKYAQKSNTLPTSLKIEHLVECFQAAGLTDIKKDKALQLFQQTRDPCCYGRNNPANANLEPPRFADEPIPEVELIYPEFVECAARAGAGRFYNNAALGLKETGEMMTLAECMLKGIKMVVNVLNPPAPTPANPGRK